jgi:rare lipoprotein A
LTVALGVAMALAACTAQQTADTVKIDPKLGVSASARVVAEGEAVPRGGGRYQVGSAYKIAGRWYEPKEDPDYDEVGLASWYGNSFHGRLTANGEIFDSASLSAAHPTLPLPSYVRVTNLDNDRSVIVRVNDRGPFSHDRLIDVSERTADLLGFRRSGTAKVRVQYVDRARLDGNDQKFLLASYRGKEPANDNVMVAMAEPRQATPQRRLRPQPATVVAAASRPAATNAATVAFAEPAASEAGEQAVSALTATYTPEDRISMTFQLIGN